MARGVAINLRGLDPRWQASCRTERRHVLVCLKRCERLSGLAAKTGGLVLRAIQPAIMRILDNARYALSLLRGADLWRSC